MDFISNKDTQIHEMLSAIGLSSVEELFAAIPSSMHLSAPKEDDGLSEFEGLQHLAALSTKNTFPHFDSYLGGGAYEHHIPAIVPAICGRSEFLTSYTPYQAETSQGMLQIIFEFQSMICALTGMDAANASVYDGANACAEAALMGMRHHKDRQKMMIAETLNPRYRAVLDQYLESHAIERITIPMAEDGRMDQAFLSQHLDSSVALVLLQSPNYLGILEDVKSISKAAKAVDCLNVQCADPLSYGLYANASENGVDIAVGDCQPLGLPLSFGGPYCGYIACRTPLLRQMPGRIVGETVDTEGKRGFVLTLQAREQHIRREKATSNICTNQALAALAALITGLWYGKEGLPKLALANFQRTAYLKDRLSSISGVKVLSKTPFFNEFAITFEQPIEQVQAIFRKHHIEPGIDLGSDYPQLKNYLLVAVTETKNQAQLDRYCQIAEEVSKR